ncbi:hypothetical protein DUNSADRAFT_5141 [Dunaliella salina]|uniref:Secreted protein n=1 Tax=Dunaliella salina TaxID=3046 RepID=A0ABQ7H7E2_DUNSA|nr:hypothetical protein DUNSADRAFT_5141 [Dunaliella salina]|eukprot:KAF5842770.1 hypothetical protein DUNSADRAFT_5141 [Dunaliella salina]
MMLSAAARTWRRVPAATAVIVRCPCHRGYTLGRQSACAPSALSTTTMGTRSAYCHATTGESRQHVQL